MVRCGAGSSVAPLGVAIAGRNGPLSGPSANPQEVTPQPGWGGPGLPIVPGVASTPQRGHAHDPMPPTVPWPTVPWPTVHVNQVPAGGLQNSNIWLRQRFHPLEFYHFPFELHLDKTTFPAITPLIFELEQCFGGASSEPCSCLTAFPANCCASAWYLPFCVYTVSR